MKERPILFSAPMVRAILDGRKIQTRRIVNPQPECLRDVQALQSGDALVIGRGCPYGSPGDRLWVREAFGYAPASLPEERAVSYKVDLKPNGWQPLRFDWPSLTVWRPSIHMPRWASRITLEITAIRVERLQDMTDDDAEAEGALVGFDDHPEPPSGLSAFRKLWASINGPDSWAQNPWVWVIEFKRINAGKEQP